ncbi:hypothetical protein [Lysobacter gummosus]|uniref:hypothetical protein n=1 Tax=Lysobacter gummosus TaxID=262324 RepID=UPI00362E0FC0
MTGCSCRPPCERPRGWDRGGRASKRRRYSRVNEVWIWFRGDSSADWRRERHSKAGSRGSRLR